MKILAKKKKTFQRPNFTKPAKKRSITISTYIYTHTHVHKSTESLSPLTARVDWSRGKRRAMGREEQMNIGVNLLDNSLVLELSSIKMAHESFYRAYMHREGKISSVRRTSDSEWNLILPRFSIDSRNRTEKKISSIKRILKIVRVVKRLN